jgi:hypothetical protein
MIVKGVNIGSSTPGRWFTEFIETKATYVDWFSRIALMNAGVVRVYTLMPPAFYAALDEYNRGNPSRPLLLIQGIWADEGAPGGNLMDPGYTESFQREIDIVVRALSGRVDVPERPYRAHGRYSSDVSEFVLGILVGRELEPDEVDATNSLNAPVTSFHGKYFVVEQGSPTEVWLARSCERTVEASTVLGWQVPVGFVNWPPLDPIEHDAEWDPRGKKFVPNDRVAINPGSIRTTTDYLAGTFTAFNVYPNYPDFINNEQGYDSYADDQGRFRYGGYLRQLKGYLPDVPALVAEFGISTSIGTAHVCPDGLHHGGLSEADQGAMIARMFRAIKRERYAGGLVFEWSDEWAKRTWITAPLMIPYDRHVLWHNVMDPEQNYGILAFMSEPAPRQVLYSKPGGAPRGPGLSVESVEAWHDAAFIYLEIRLNRAPHPSEGIVVGIDTVAGVEPTTTMLSPGISVNGCLEFGAFLGPGDEGALLVNPGYNYHGGKYMSKPGDPGWERIAPITNLRRVGRDGRVYPEIRADHSSLHYGSFDHSSDEFNSRATWYRRDGSVLLRLPWALIGFSDPSSRRVLWDSRTGWFPTAVDQVNTVVTEGVAFFLAPTGRSGEGADNRADSPPGQETVGPVTYRWNGWEFVTCTPRLKSSYGAIAEAFAE